MLTTLAVLAVAVSAKGPRDDVETIPPLHPATQCVRVDEESSEMGAEKPCRWYLLLAGVNAYPKMGSEKPIDDYYNPLLQFLAPELDNLKTVGGLRDRGFLWAPHIGVGRVLSEHWAVFVQVGYTAGSVRSNDMAPSRIFLLPLHSDFEIKRSALYAGLGLDYFPFGVVEMGEYHGFKDRLRAAKPFVGARYTWTHATYDVKVKLGFNPIRNLLNVGLHDDWTIPSVGGVVGVDIPLTKRSVLSLNASANKFSDQELDFDGPSFTIAWKRFFR